MTNSAVKVIGTIDTMQTLVENFPMSILDLRNGPTYTSSFSFMVDVLKACGLTIERIIEYAIEEIYGYKIDSEEFSVQNLYETLDKLEISEQSPFVATLEDSVKAIIMSVLVSLFSCSVHPYIPTEYTDEPNRGSAGGYKGMYIPTELIDYFGYFNTSPFSWQGKMYYEVEGGDVYYKKVKTAEAEESPISPKIEKQYYNVSLKFARGFGGEKRYCFTLDKEISQNIFILVQTDAFSHLFTIKAGDTKSEVFDLSQSKKITRIGFEVGQRLPINSENYQSTSIVIDSNGDKCLILDKEGSKDAIKHLTRARKLKGSNIVWHTATEEVAPPDADNTFYTYVKSDKRIEGAARVYSTIKATSGTPEAIVRYEGVDPNTLYKSSDLNAFIWYVLNRGGNVPQNERNKNMWDSRRTAKQEGIERTSSEDWNNWYNSKQTAGGAFSYIHKGKHVEQIIKPILQFNQENSNLYVQFPCQTYYRTTPKSSYIASKIFNSTIYEFDWDYLKSIRIFNPKALLFGMFDGLLNGALTAYAGANLSLSVQETNARLSAAIKKYIEMDDSSVSDCYMSFSNEDFDSMLEDMLLARYNAAKAGGEFATAQQHNIEDYLNNINEVNLTSSPQGATSQIMRTITDVTLADSEGESAIDINISGDFKNEGYLTQILWAMCMPIIKALFSPQIILLFLINFNVMGIVSVDDLFTENASFVLKFICNKIFAMVRSIILFIKDKFVLLLFRLFIVYSKNLLNSWGALEAMERLDAWLQLLAAIALCIPKFNFGKSKTEIDEVDYADITESQDVPENTENC